MSDLIKKELIRIEDHANDWKDAIRIAAKSLLDNGYINEQYVADMIKSVEDAGPYIVLA
ncbi:MAG: PTS sugar transporter subunit IIA, partial [Finegoldia magna]|nr:PTS sugar transporter subunit IIA [Finegoldia magna]